MEGGREAFACSYGVGEEVDRDEGRERRREREREGKRERERDEERERRWTGMEGERLLPAATEWEGGKE